MDDKKLKIAFLRVRNDYNALNEKLDELKNQVQESSNKAHVEDDIGKSLRKLNKVDFEKFTNNLEAEFKNINKLIDEFNKRFIETGEVIKKFSVELEKYNVEIEDIKKHLARTSNTTANNDLDVNLMGEQLGEYQELLREKVDLEIGSMRLEFTEEIAKLYDRIDSKLNEKHKKKEKNKKVAKSNEPNRIKKAVKWLIEGDDDEDFSDIKSEVKKGK